MVCVGRSDARCAPRISSILIFSRRDFSSAGKRIPTPCVRLPDPVYFGGTVDRSVTSEHIVSGVRSRGLQAMAFAERGACGDKLIELAEPGDRIVVMGARDDTLSVFAAELVERLSRK